MQKLDILNTNLLENQSDWTADDTAVAVDLGLLLANTVGMEVAKDKAEKEADVMYQKVLAECGKQPRFGASSQRKGAYLKCSYQAKKMANMPVDIPYEAPKKSKAGWIIGGVLGGLAIIGTATYFIVKASK